MKEVDKVFATLRQLTADNPAQQQRLDGLKPVLDARLATLAESIDVRRAQGLAAAIARERSTGTGTGKQLHEGIRLIIREMAQTETTLLREREQISAEATGVTQGIIVAGGALAVALIGLSVLLGIGELRRRHTAEQALVASNVELTDVTARALRADHLKSAFLATMSNELRTPLNSIIGFSAILRQELAGPLNAEQAKQLDMVLNSARHLLALINDVLDLSKIEAGEMNIARAPFNLRVVIDRAVASVRPLAEKKGLALSTRLAPDVEPLLGDLLSDSRRVQQVLINLLNNAVKFTEHGAVELEVDLPPDDASCLRLRVRDSGQGIKPEDLEILFKPFRQVDTGLARQHEGSGLGLAICQRLATLLGGRIEVDSHWGQGSAFTFILPLAVRARS